MSLSAYLTIFCTLLLATSSNARAVDGDNASGKLTLKAIGGNDLAKCKLNAQQRPLGVLPGVGWDNIENTQRGPTINRESYSRCRYSPDGRFLLPDDVVIAPTKSSRVDLSSKIFKSSQKYESATASSINSGSGFGTSFVSINGDFSLEKSSLRGSEASSRGSIVRTELRHKRLTTIQMPDSPLHPRFLNRLLDIAALIGQLEGQTSSEKDNQKSQLIAYYADLIVRDFGTHSISAVDAGALLIKTDMHKSNMEELSHSDRLKVSASASASFGKLFSFKTGTSHSSSESDEKSYEESVEQSFVTSYGGPILKASDMNVSHWEEGVELNMVPIDRHGHPIHELITPRTLTQLTPKIVILLSQAVKEAVLRYYEANMRVGCTDPSSKYYDSDANVDSKNCDEAPIDSSAILPLGGFYQVCQGPDDLCSGYEVKNSQTADLKCPEGYLAIQMVPEQKRLCARKCVAKGWGRGEECVKECAVTLTYWCPQDPSRATDSLPVAAQESGFLFGGLYTDSDINVVTDEFSCPRYFTSIALGRRMRICVSTDRELGSTYAMPFGGLYSCLAGNPLTSLLETNQPFQDTSNEPKRRRKRSTELQFEDPIGGGVPQFGLLMASMWPKRCPVGYSSHSAAIEDICQPEPEKIIAIPNTIPQSDGSRLVRSQDGRWVDSRSEFAPGDQSVSFIQPRSMLAWFITGWVIAGLELVCIAIMVLIIVMHRRHSA